MGITGGKSVSLDQLEMIQCKEHREKKIGEKKTQHKPSIRDLPDNRKNPDSGIIGIPEGTDFS